MSSHYLTLTEKYCSLVQVFATSLLEIYRVAVKTNYPSQQETIDKLLANAGIKLYELDWAEEAFRRFNLELCGDLTPRERDSLGLVFAKRHTLVFQNELVQWKYYWRIRPYLWLFRRVHVSNAEYERNSEVVQQLITRASKAIALPR